MVHMKTRSIGYRKDIVFGCLHEQYISRTSRINDYQARSYLTSSFHVQQESGVLSDAELEADKQIIPRIENSWDGSKPALTKRREWLAKKTKWERSNRATRRIETGG